MGTHEHKKHAPRKVSIGIITVSTTRALVDDASGNWISEQARKEGHDVVYHQVITDDAGIIASTFPVRFLFVVKSPSRPRTLPKESRP